MEVVEIAVSAEKLTALGQDGFVFFAIVMVAFMFLFMGFIAYKALSKIMNNHNKNEERIDDAHKRIISLEDRESKCITRVEAVTTELKECIRQLKSNS